MTEDLVLVPGRFAVIHPGHIRLFRHARSMANSVVVALDITGISNEEMRWRSGALKGIPYVNEVVYFEGSLKEIILNLKPKYLLRFGDSY
jgi:cytidyltransferase-like protein